MKLSQIAEKTENNKSGSYVAVRFDEDTKERLKKFAVDNKIPNPLRIEKYHTTVLYSLKYDPTVEAIGAIDPPIVGEPIGFDVWKSSGTNGKPITNCLVLTYKCPELDKRHEELHDQYDVQHTFDDYHAHITLSYDIGDFDIDGLDAKEIGPINIIEEYYEDLDLDWANK